MRDAEIADAAGRLPLSQCPEVRSPVEEIVDLDQVEPRGAQPLERLLHLRRAGVASARPDLRGQEELVGDRELGGEVADDRFGRAVHRRGVDHATAHLDEVPEHVFQGRPLGWRAADVEHAPRAEPDRGNRLAGRRNRTTQHPGRGPGSSRKRRRSRHQPQHLSPRKSPGTILMRLSHFTDIPRPQPPNSCIYTGVDSGIHLICFGALLF